MKQVAPAVHTWACIDHEHLGVTALKRHTQGSAPSLESSPDGVSYTAAGWWFPEMRVSDVGPSSNPGCPLGEALGEWFCLPCSARQPPGQPPSPFHQHQIH